MYEEWIAQFPLRKYDKGSWLFLQGDPLDYCYFLTKGICSQLVGYENGEEIVTRFYFPGDILNIWGLLKHRSICSSTAAAKTDACVRVIPASILREKLETSFDFYRWIVEFVLTQNQYIYDQYKKKSKGAATEMICYLIRTLSQRDSQGALYLPKEFTLNDIALHLRIHRVTVSRVFKSLQEQGIIRKYKHGWLIVKPEELEHCAQGS